MTASSMGLFASSRKSLPLDDLLVELYCLLDDALPRQRMGRPRRTSDAEVVVLAVAQMLLDCPSDGTWLDRADRRLGHLFRRLPSRAQYNRRVRALVPLLRRALDLLATRHPGTLDDLLLVDSTAVSAGSTRLTATRSDLADTAAYGRAVSSHRFYWGYKLVLAVTPDGFPIGYDLLAANRSEIDALRAVLPRVRPAGRTLLADRGYASRALAAEVAGLGGRLLITDRKGASVAARRLRQRVEQVFADLKLRLGLERHGGRSIAAVTARILARLLALAAVIERESRLGTPGRHVAAYAR